MVNSAQKDILLVLARVLLSSLFLIMGWSKLQGFGMAVGYMQSLGVPLPSVAAAIAVIVELGGGLAILTGVLASPVAILLAPYTIVTAFIGHHFWTFPAGMVHYDMMIHFYKNMSVAGGLLALGITGPGRYALFSRSSS
ncbi:DoxX family membrane protein [Saccharibacter sp. 17.LH.SD]|uniref:DoxX family protein n=1 Tax=Saccharibacter sp. 17.LH.SD TaxID=2689393 RepID=UPI00136F7F66|nr:DoxX family protein [Saccharibacter sp. 17.LH.SD]MXV43699.1 DoxX family membrane protein [Saccharibacter sp. 17.LH.SD]